MPACEIPLRVDENGNGMPGPSTSPKDTYYEIWRRTRRRQNDGPHHQVKPALTRTTEDTSTESSQSIVPSGGLTETLPSVIATVPNAPNFEESEDRATGRTSPLDHFARTLLGVPDSAVQASPSLQTEQTFPSWSPFLDLPVPLYQFPLGPLPEGMFDANKMLADLMRHLTDGNEPEQSDMALDPHRSDTASVPAHQPQYTKETESPPHAPKRGGEADGPHCRKEAGEAQ